MSNVFVCGAEGLALPQPGENDDNSARYSLVVAFLVWELSALFNVRYLTNLAYDPASSIGGFFNGALTAVIPVSPNAITHPNVVVTTSTIPLAIIGFGADLIINLNGGISPNAVLQSEIATLQAQAFSSGVLWRDAANIGYEAVFPRPLQGGAVFTRQEHPQ